MPRHSVTASMNVIELSKSGSAIELVINSDDEVLGTMRIGRGSIGWKAKNKQTYNDIPWPKFAKMIEKECS